MAEVHGFSSWLKCMAHGGGGGQLQSVRMRPTPRLSVKTCGGGGGVGRRLGGGCIGSSAGGSQGGGGLCTTHYYHMHTSRVCVCLGAWGYRGMYAIITISRLCQEESLKGLKDQRHSTPFQLSMGQKIWRCWRHGPRTAIFQNSGGGGEGGGGWGGVAYKDRARPPPPWHGLSSWLKPCTSAIVCTAFKPFVSAPLFPSRKASFGLVTANSGAATCNLQLIQDNGNSSDIHHYPPPPPRVNGPGHVSSFEREGALTRAWGVH